MSEIYIRIPDQQPELESAITEFIKNEFKQQALFVKEPSFSEVHKGDLLNILWTGLTVIATLEGTLQFAERVKRLERVKKLLDVIKKSGKSVYLKINKDEAVDLSKKSVNEAMDLLIEKDKKDEKE